jgi:hypothetical protein
MASKLGQNCWESFDLICSSSTNAFSRLLKLSKFIKAIAAASEDYANTISKLSSPSGKKGYIRSRSHSLSADNLFGRPDELGEILQLEMTKLAEIHSYFATRLVERVAEPLALEVKNMLSKCEGIVRKGQEDRKVFEEAVNRMNKTRMAYYRAHKQVVSLV